MADSFELLETTTASDGVNHTYRVTITDDLGNHHTVQRVVHMHRAERRVAQRRVERLAVDGDHRVADRRVVDPFQTAEAIQARGELILSIIQAELGPAGRAERAAEAQAEIDRLLAEKQAIEAGEVV